MADLYPTLTDPGLGGSSLWAENGSTTYLSTLTQLLAVGLNVAQEKSHFHKEDSTASRTRYSNNTTGSGASNGVNVGLNDNEEGEFWVFEDKPLIFGTKDLDRGRWTKDGEFLVGGSTPSGSKMDVFGSLTIGSGLAGVSPAPTDGILVQGWAGFGDATVPEEELEVRGNKTADNVAIGVKNTGASNSVAGFYARNNLDYRAAMAIQDSATNDPLYYSHRLGRTVFISADGSPGMSFLNESTGTFEYYIGGRQAANRLHFLSSIGWSVNTSQNDEAMTVGGASRYTGTVANLTSSTGALVGFDAIGQFSIRNYANGPLRLCTNNTEWVRLNSTGSLLVSGGFSSFSGTLRKIHVHDTGSGGSNMLFTNSTTGTNSNTDGFLVGIGADEHALLLQKENLPLSFWTNNITRGQFTASGDFLAYGKVGLGTATTPVGEFELRGAKSAGNIGLFVRNTNASYSATQVRVNNNANHGGALVIGDSVTSDAAYHAYLPGKVLLQSVDGAAALNFASRATNGYMDFYFEGISSSHRYHRFDKNGLALGSATVTTLLNLADGGDVTLGTSSGTKWGTAANQKQSFWGKSPIVQPTNSITPATFVANSSGISDDTATWGNYQVGHVVQALIDCGILQ